MIGSGGDRGTLETRAHLQGTATTPASPLWPRGAVLWLSLVSPLSKRNYNSGLFFGFAHDSGFNAGMQAGLGPQAVAS